MHNFCFHNSSCLHRKGCSNNRRHCNIHSSSHGCIRPNSLHHIPNNHPSSHRSRDSRSKEYSPNPHKDNRRCIPSPNPRRNQSLRLAGSKDRHNRIQYKCWFRSYKDRNRTNNDWCNNYRNSLHHLMDREIF